MKYLIFLTLFIVSVISVFAAGNDEGSEIIRSPGTPPPGAEREFSTDFSKSIISFEEILSGGPPKDGIPPIDDPEFISLADVKNILKENEPVLTLRIGEECKIYPLRVLMWHEIVNDNLADIAVAVTYCPLCNTGIAFNRQTDYGTLDFGTTGRLRFSNLIMYDRQTESWWQQATGEAVVGELTGILLEMIPVQLMSFSAAASSHPEALVLSEDTGHDRPYGKNPYTGYDSSDEPFLYTGPPPGAELNPLDRVIVIETTKGMERSIAYSDIAEKKVMMLEKDGIAVFFEESAASALDSGIISEGRIVGSALAYSSVISGMKLSFIYDEGKIRDTQTGSSWNLSGTAESGALEGTRLTPVTAVNHFWFSYNAFFN